MGCCASTPSDPPYAEQTSSSRAINAQPQFIAAPAIPRPSTGASSAAPRTTRLTDAVDQPLKLHIWKARRSKKWTRQTIDQEREDYFYTSSATNVPEIWQTLKTVCEVLWPVTIPGATTQEKTDAVATAQGILVAAEITLPTGDLSDGAYDRFGNHYKLPEYVVADPTNLIWEEPELDKDKVVEAEDSEVDDETLRRREEKGKSIAIEDEDLLKLRAKMSEGTERLDIKIGKNDTAKTVSRKIHDKANLSKEKSIKLIYMGKLLKDNESLPAQGWKEDNAVSAFVFTAA